MITLQELTEHLDSYLDIASFSDFCPNGLQVEGKSRVKRVCTAVTGSQETIDAAIEARADALVVHHGFFWKGEPQPVVGRKKRRLEALLKGEMSLLAYHLPLDAHQEVGNNWVAARKLGLSDLSPLGEVGVQGQVDPERATALVQRLESYYGQTARTALFGPDIVTRVGIISGGGYRYLADAKALGVELYVTGNCDEPVWHVAKEEAVHFVSVGHSNSEKTGPKALATYIQKRFGIETQFLDLPNPF